MPDPMDEAKSKARGLALTVAEHFIQMGLLNFNSSEMDSDAGNNAVAKLDALADDGTRVKVDIRVSRPT